MSELDDQMSKLGIASIGMMVDCPQVKTKKVIEGRTMEEISTLATFVCNRCPGRALCNILKNRHNAEYKIPLVKCTRVAKYIDEHRDYMANEPPRHNTIDASQE